MLKVHLQAADLQLLLVLLFLVHFCFDFKVQFLISQVNAVSIIFKKDLHNVSQKFHLLLSHVYHQF